MEAVEKLSECYFIGEALKHVAAQEDWACWESGVQTAATSVNMAFLHGVGE